MPANIPVALGEGASPVADQTQAQAFEWIEVALVTLGASLAIALVSLAAVVTTLATPT